MLKNCIPKLEHLCSLDKQKEKESLGNVGDKEEGVCVRSVYYGYGLIRNGFFSSPDKGVGLSTESQGKKKKTKQTKTKQKKKE